MKKLSMGIMAIILGICICAGTLLAVDKSDQTITFNALPGKVYGDANFAPGATASSSLTVTYTSSNPLVATIVSGKIHITGVGSSTITAQQAGNASWNAAPTVPQDLTVAQGTPVITWANPADIIYGKPLSASQLDARANVPGKFEYDPASGIILSAGAPHDLDVTFTPTDAVRYTVAQKTVSLTVNQATPTITIAGQRQKYDGDPHEVTVSTVPAGLNVDVTYNGDSTAPTNIGLYAVVATVNDPNAKAATKSAIMVIGKGVQTITFPPPQIKVLGDADFSPNATSSSGLTVAYASSNLNVATILGGMIHIVGKGSAVITATQPGNGTWNAAVAVKQTVKVTTINQTITFNALPDKVCGAANFAPGATASSGLVVTYASSNLDVATIVGGKIHITGAGTSIITAEQADNATWNAAPQVTQTLTVAANVPTYPIAEDVYTTLEKTIVAIDVPADAKALLPCEVSEYAVNGYGLFNPDGGPAPFLLTNMIDMSTGVSGRDPLAATLLTFFSMSDTHLTDKESPAQAIYYGYEAGPLSNISAYSAIILYTTHVLDAAIQTVNVLNKRTPFDFGIDLGDAVNNNQYNELRWFIDVFDGQRITPSSGAHLGATTIDYQKPYQAAGLDKSIKWYQAMGNHDPFWTGCLLANDYIKETIVSSSILNLGSSSASYAGLSLRGFYMGVVDGTTKYGDIIDVGPVEYYLNPPKVAPDPDRRSLSIRDWMGEFLKSTTLPAGHGVTNELINDGLLCYTFHPRADIPLKVIVLDDIDKGGSANGTLDYQRYDWLVKELDEGEAAGELMIVCAHIPIHPYAPPPTWSDPDTPSYYTLFATYSMISEEALLQKLWTYQNLIMWVSGHVHRSAITNQPPGAAGISSDYTGDLTHGFWEVETPSLRDFPQQFRHFEIVRNSDNNISIFALDVDPAARAPAEVGASAPAWTSRSYALAGHQIYQVPAEQGPNVDPTTGVYNAELVKQLSPAMQAKLALIIPAVSSFQINGNAIATTSQTVTLNSTVAGTAPTHYMASEDSDFDGAAWLPYSKAPAFILSAGAGTKTVYLKVKDGSGTESASVNGSIVLK